MTRKDYIRIAKAIRQSFGALDGICNSPQEKYAAQRATANVIFEIGDQLGEDNPRFDRGRFLQACMPETTD